jgi:hypothetical protein
MGLDDSCCDFVSLYARKKIPLAQNIDMLLESLDWYTSQSDNYPTDKGSKLDALRRAAKRVKRADKLGDQKAFQEALWWLLELADMGPYSDDDIDRWCARWLRRMELITEDRCPDCGGPDEHKNVHDDR